MGASLVTAFRQQTEGFEEKPIAAGLKAAKAEDLIRKLSQSGSAFIPEQNYPSTDNPDVAVLKMRDGRIKIKVGLSDTQSPEIAMTYNNEGHCETIAVSRYVLPGHAVYPANKDVIDKIFAASADVAENNPRRTAAFLHRLTNAFDLKPDGASILELSFSMNVSDDASYNLYTRYGAVNAVAKLHDYLFNTCGAVKMETPVSGPRLGMIS